MPLVADHVLAVRLDSAGDILVTGPALRALAAGSHRLTVLAGPLGAEAAEILPGIDDVTVWQCPWIAAEPGPVDRSDVDGLVRNLRRRRIDAAVVFTSFHQSALPTALLLRLAGIRVVAAISDDYPGSLLDVRHRVDDDIPEPERALSLARAAGFEVPEGDDGRLALRQPLPDITGLRLPARPYVVLHPGASVPARAWPAKRWAAACSLLSASGRQVVVTGGAAERDLTAAVAAAGASAVDLGGRTSLPDLAAVLAGAEAVVVANTGPAHLAAAVGTPVVSLFAPTVPAARWAPYGVPLVLLGDQHAPCRDTRARECPVPGHPCLAPVSAEDVRRAVEQLTWSLPHATDNGRPPGDSPSELTREEAI